jgi:hypothetical protein
MTNTASFNPDQNLSLAGLRYWSFDNPKATGGITTCSGAHTVGLTERTRCDEGRVREGPPFPGSLVTAASRTPQTTGIGSH